MNRSEIINAIRSQKAELRSKGVIHLALFGSYSRGDERTDSDLDVLVDIDPQHKTFSLLDLAGVSGILADKTGLEINLAERKSLEPRFTRRIADDVIEVF